MKKLSQSERMLGNQYNKKYLNLIDAIQYLIKNSVYKNEWTGAGMYEAIVKIVPSKRVKIKYLDELLKEAENF